MAYALHTWALSLAQLRRLHFPDEKTGHNQKKQRDEAARTVLAALALYALGLQQERGYWLRSRCHLVLDGPVELELIGGSGDKLRLGTALKIRNVLDQATKQAESLHLTWSKAVTRLVPTEKLLDLVRLSDAVGPEPEPEVEVETADAGAES